LEERKKLLNRMPMITGEITQGRYIMVWKKPVPFTKPRERI
jgi:hypothetical protein